MAQDIVIPNFYDYVKQLTNGPENLSEAELEVLRKKYKTHRNRLYKQRQRTKNRECILYLNSSEHTQLKKISQEHNLLLSQYIKQASFAYANQTFIVPDRETLKNILLKIKEIEQNIAKLANNQSSRLFFKEDKYEALVQNLKDLEHNVLVKITRPINTEAWIKNELATNPIFRKTIISYLLTEMV